MKNRQFLFFTWLRVFRPYFYNLLIFIGGIGVSRAQESGKLSPALRMMVENNSTTASRFVIGLSTDSKVFLEHIVKLPGTRLVYSYPSASVVIIECSPEILRSSILNRDEVVFADIMRTPREEVAVSNIDMGVNKVSTVHRYFPQFRGAGNHVSLKENLPDTADIDFKGRYVTSPFESSAFSSHATIMGTLIAGGGNTFYEGRGVAPATTFSSVNFQNLLPEPDAYYQQFNVVVQNHSYGTGIENYYGADARSYDMSVMNRPALTHVFSVGNSGSSAGTGAYLGIVGFANTTGSFKMAKNIISVGHTDSSGQVLPGSSKGPAYDGRLMPSLVAFGEDGSSGAAAIVSGVATLLHDVHRQLYGTTAGSDLVRAILFNTASDTGPVGIDYQSGFGAVDAFKAIRELAAGVFFNGTVTDGTQQTHSIQVPPGMKTLRVTLTWNDPAAAANATTALVNDLDLEVTEPVSGVTTLPWVLSSFPHPDSLNKLPARRKDHLNNSEQVTIDLPIAGSYNLVVKGFQVTGTQSYSLAYGFDTLNVFQWVYPTSADPVLGGKGNMIRWRSGYAAGEIDSVQFTIDNGVSWQTIARAPLDNEFVRWTPPDTFHLAYLLMHIGTQSFSSEPFVISNRQDVRVGFNCTDSFSLYWPRLPNATHYNIYELGSQYMAPFMNTTDTFVVLRKFTHPSTHFAVAPALGPFEGIRSYAYDYSTQGVGCYFRTFFASLISPDHMALLELELGTTYGIQSITWEQWSGGGFVPLHSFIPATSNSYQYIDSQLITGTNQYRVRIRLLNGQDIYSSIETIFSTGRQLYSVYPNPVVSGETLHFVHNETEEVTLRIFNNAGTEIQRWLIDAPVFDIATTSLRKGIYFLEFKKKDGTTEVHRLLVF